MGIEDINGRLHSAAVVVCVKSSVACRTHSWGIKNPGNFYETRILALSKSSKSQYSPRTNREITCTKR